MTKIEHPFEKFDRFEAETYIRRGVIHQYEQDDYITEKLYNPKLFKALTQLANEGKTRQAVAEILGCSPPWISMVLRDKYPRHLFPHLHDQFGINRFEAMTIGGEAYLKRLVFFHIYKSGKTRLVTIATMLEMSSCGLLMFMKRNYPDNDYYEGIEYHLDNEAIDINTRMKFRDILEWVNYNRISGPYDIKDEFEEESRIISLVRRDENETVAGSLTIEGNTITGMDIDTTDYRDVAQDLINYVCGVADQENFNLMVDAKTADGRIKSFLSLAGFRHGDDNILMRTPGAARII